MLFLDNCYLGAKRSQEFTPEYLMNLVIQRKHTRSITTFKRSFRDPYSISATVFRKKKGIYMNLCTRQSISHLLKTPRKINQKKIFEIF